MLCIWRGYLAAAAVAALFAGASASVTPARGQAVAFGPVIGQFNEGVVMGVAPAVSADRRYVRIGGGAAFTGLRGMNVVNVPGAVAGGGRGGFVPGGFRQMPPGVGNNGIMAGGMAAPSASVFAAEAVVPGGWYGGYPGWPGYGYGYGYGGGYYPPVVSGVPTINAPFGGFGPAPGYGTVNALLPLSNSIRYGVGRGR